MSKTVSMKFQHPSEREEYAKFFPDESGINELVTTIRGRMGRESDASVIFRASRHGTPFAVKVYKKKLPQSKEETERRIRVLKALPHHSRICHVEECIPYHSDEDNADYTYIVMEYINGDALDTLLKMKHEHRFQQSEVLNWACQLLDVLAYFHQHDLSLHLKLSNIVRRHNGSICISDISHFVSHDDTDVVSLSNDPDAQYPEDSASPQDLSAVLVQDAQVRKDLSHLGVIMFQLLTGAEPEPNLSREKIKRALKNCNVRENVADVIAKALDRVPENQYGSADAMREDLLRLPLESPERKKHIARVTVDIVTVIIGLFLGSLFFFGGLKMEKRAQEMARLTERANEEWIAGKYTDAKADIADALRRKSHFFEPDCTAKTMQTAATISGVCDLRAGYKPDFSLELDGQPLAAVVSPDETTAAVMTSESSALSFSPVHRIHFVDLNTREEKWTPVETYSGDKSSFFFLDNQVFVYINASGSLDYWDPEPLEDENHIPLSPGSKIIRATISGKRNVIACLLENGSVYFAWFDDDERILRGTIVSTDVAIYKTLSPENQLFALNDDGTRLTFIGEPNVQENSETVPKSRLLVYQFDNLIDSIDPTGIKLVDEEFKLDCSSDVHYEGGFCQDAIAVAGWYEYAADMTMSQRDVYAMVYAFNPNYKQPTIINCNNPVHMTTDEDDIYYSDASNVYQIFDSGESLSSKAAHELDGSVHVLMGIENMVAAVTENEKVVIWQEGRADVTLSGGTDFSGAAMSNNYLLLFGQTKKVDDIPAVNTLSVMKWDDRTPFLAYDSDFSHQRFQVLANQESAMLYGMENQEVFRVYPSGTDNTARNTDSPDNFDKIQTLLYLRPLSQRDPQEEYLKVVYPNASAYYSAATGKLADHTPDQAYVAEGLKAGTARTWKYLLSKRAGGQLEIIPEGKETPRKTISVPGTIIDAYEDTETGTLLVTLLDDENRPNARLLDRNLSVIAELSGSFTMLQDGTIYRDDHEGSIFQGKAWTRESLAKKLNAPQPESGG